MNEKTNTIKKIIKDETAAFDFNNLESKIILSVRRIEKRKYYLKASLWTFFAFIASFGLVTSGVAVYQQFLNSGARELFIIAVTDTSVILANGTDFFYSLAESLPIGNISALLLTVAAFLYSLRHLAEIYINNVSNIYGHKQAN